MRILALAAVALLVSVPAAAQLPVPASGVTVTLGAVAPVPPEGSGTIPLHIEVGCGALIQNAGDGEVQFTFEGGPEWLAFTPPEASFGLGPDCASPTATLAQDVAIQVTPSPTAPGRTPAQVTVTVTVGSAAASVDVPLVVDYRPGHTITPDISFPATVNGDKLTFNVTIDVTANARSMVMFEQVSASSGSVSGLRSTVMETPKVTLPVTFTAPTGDWTEATVRFHNYSHYLVGSAAGGPELAQDYTWTFVPGTEAEHEHEEEKDSPAAGTLLIAGLAAAAFLVRRRL